jgi:hypothetical protein
MKKKWEFQKELENIKKNQVKILQLKNIMIQQKISIKSFHSSFIKQKNQGAQTGHLKLPSERIKKKKMKMSKESYGTYELVTRTKLYIKEFLDVQRKRKGEKVCLEKQ